MRNLWFYIIFLICAILRSKGSKPYDVHYIETAQLYFFPASVTKNIGHLKDVLMLQEPHSKSFSVFSLFCFHPFQAWGYTLSWLVVKMCLTEHKIKYSLIIVYSPLFVLHLVFNCLSPSSSSHPLAASLSFPLSSESLSFAPPLSLWQW